MTLSPWPSISQGHSGVFERYFVKSRVFSVQVLASSDEPFFSPRGDSEIGLPCIRIGWRRDPTSPCHAASAGCYQQLRIGAFSGFNPPALIPIQPNGESNVGNHDDGERDPVGLAGLRT